MTYTQLAVLSVVLSILLDLTLLKTRLVRRKGFWVSYAIIVSFQLITNGMFTGFGIVLYSDAAILGGASPESGTPSFLGDGRICFAPVEDLLFGFSLVLLTLSTWVALGRRGIQREPAAGPPIWRRR